MEKERMCTCGDPESHHVDGMDQCTIPECGCKEFEDVCPLGLCDGSGIVSEGEFDDIINKECLHVKEQKDYGSGTL